MNETQLLKNSPSRGEDRCLSTESFVFSGVLEICQVFYGSNSSWGVGEWGPELRQEGFLEVMMMSYKNKCGFVRQKGIEELSRQKVNKGMW